MGDSHPFELKTSASTIPAHFIEQDCYLGFSFFETWQAWGGFLSESK